MQRFEATTPVLFLSDLHLSPHRPGASGIFQRFLRGRARSARQIFILGDLFDAWPGDDCLQDPRDDFVNGLVGDLADLVSSGIEVLVMHGNRDFLLGDGFVARTGARLVPDPYVLSLPTWQFVLSHGDAACTDDREYQAFRSRVRRTEWRSAFLAKSLDERKQIATQLRAQSERAKQDKAGYLMDVNPSAIDDFLRAHGYASMIHGHTHRPATHHHIVDGIEVERWVLSDWCEERGECLSWNGRQLTREILT